MGSMIASFPVSLGPCSVISSSLSHVSSISSTPVKPPQHWYILTSLKTVEYNGVFSDHASPSFSLVALLPFIATTWQIFCIHHLNCLNLHQFPDCCLVLHSALFRHWSSWLKPIDSSWCFVIDLLVAPDWWPLFSSWITFFGFWNLFPISSSLWDHYSPPPFNIPPLNIVAINLSVFVQLQISSFPWGIPNLCYQDKIISWVPGL